MSYTAKSVILDIADNWGGITFCGLRSLDFNLASVLVDIEAGDILAVYGAESGPDYQVENAFITALSKTGGIAYTTWVGAPDTFNRIICVFVTPIEFDGIVINNYHGSGGTTNRGIKNVKITISTDAISDTTYNAAIANSTVIYDSIFWEHIASDIQDDQTLALGDPIDGELDIRSLTYDSVSLSFGATAAKTMSAVFNPDGSEIFTIDYTDKKVYQHTLGTNWDLTTATLIAAEYSVATQITYAAGLSFSPDGTKMYASDYVNKKIFQYTLSSAWDITSATYASKSLDMTAQTTTDARFQFSPSGNVLFVNGDSNNYKLFEYVLSTPWDISTASYSTFLSVGVSNDHNPLYGGAAGIAVASDGKQMFLSNKGGLLSIDSYILQYTMSVAWNLSTAVYTNKFVSVDAEVGVPYSLFFKADDTILYAYDGQSNLLYQYSTNITESVDITLDIPSFESTMFSGADMAVRRTVPKATIWAKIYALNFTQPARTMEATTTYCFVEALLPTRIAAIETAEPLHLAFTLPAFTSLMTSTITTFAQMTVDLSKRSGRMYVAGRIITTLPKRTMVSTAVHSRPATMEATLPVVTMDSYAAGQIRVKLKPFISAITATNTHLASITISLPSYLSDIIATNKSLHPLAVTIPSYRMSGTISKANRATMTATWERFSFYADGYYGGVASMTATIPIRKAVLNASFSTGNSFIISLPMFTCNMAADNYTDIILRHVRGALR